MNSDTPSSTERDDAARNRRAEGRITHALAYGLAQTIIRTYCDEAAEAHRGCRKMRAQILAAGELYENLLRDVYGDDLRFDSRGRARIKCAVPTRGVELILSGAPTLARTMLEDVLQGAEKEWPNGAVAVQEMIGRVIELAPKGSGTAKADGADGQSTVNRVVFYRDVTGHWFDENGRQLTEGPS